MERVAVESHDIAVVGYARETRELEITFRRGGVYHYQNVPESVYRELMAAPSVGSYFSQNIKDKYPCRKATQSK